MLDLELKLVDAVDHNMENTGSRGIAVSDSN